MLLEISPGEQEILKKILESYLSELRLEIAATKRDTTSLHKEEDIIKELLKKIS